MLTAAALLVLHGGVHFVGTHHCPSPDQVARAFVPIEAEADARDDETVTIEPDASGGARLRFGSAGTERPLPPGLSCAERAQAAAVILAAHLLSRSRAEAAPIPAVRPAALPVPAAAPAAAVLRARTPDAHSPPEARSSRIELQLGLQGACAGSSLAPGVRGGLAHTRGGHQLRLEVGFTGTESIPIAGARATWSRSALALAYARRFTWGTREVVFFNLGVEALASQLRLGSEGFRRTEVSTTFHPGLGAQARAGRALGRRVAAFAGLGATLWPRVHRVYLRDVPETTTLPRFELMLTLGASWAIL